MTKKDYELLQSTFDIGWMIQHYPWYKSERTAERKSYDAIIGHVSQLARRMADKLAEQDPKFDKVRFLRGCGFNDKLLMHYKEIPRTPDYNYFEMF